MTGKPTISLDDCADDTLLESLLTQAGYTVVTPRSAGTKGWRDPGHLHYAAQYGYALLISNPADFVALHQQWYAEGQTHSGILLVYYDKIQVHIPLAVAMSGEIDWHAIDARRKNRCHGRG